MNDQEKIHRIVRSFREVNRAFYQLMHEDSDQLGITATQLFVLRMLAKNPNISLGELAEKTHVGNSTMSGIIERLVKADLVVRERCETDRRSLTMRLTPQGEEKAKAAYHLFMNKLSHLLEISDEELEQLLHIHAHILEKIERGR